MKLWHFGGPQVFARVTSAPKPNQRTKKGPSKAALTPMWATVHYYSGPPTTWNAGTSLPKEPQPSHHATYQPTADQIN